MKINIDACDTNPNVNIGDMLITHSGRKILLVKTEYDKVFALDLSNSTLTSREYNSVEEFLKNYSFNYTVYNADNIELSVKGGGKIWQ